MTGESYDALLRICEARKSTRIFDPRPVPDNLLEQIRTVALTSPYASGRKNWDVAIVTDKDILHRMKKAVEIRVQTICSEMREDMQNQFTDYARNFTFFAQAPAVFVPVFRAAPALSLMVASTPPDILQWERDNHVKSISCVAMLVLLAAESLGLGACFVTGALVAEQELTAVLRLPAGRSIGALIPVGYKTGGGQT